MKKTACIAVALAGGFLIASTSGFPAWGDALSPASLHISPRFIAKAFEETGTPNIVTAVLADYRGFDTLLETIVVFTAALACFLIIRRPGDDCAPNFYHYRHRATGIVARTRDRRVLPDHNPAFTRIDADWTPQNVVVVTTCRLAIPFIQIFGLYVLMHGHYSPGGGFQSGVIFAASYVLLAVSQDLRALSRQLAERAAHLLSLSGVLLYFGIGLSGLAGGANFLDYGGLAGILGISLASGHSLGILLVEIGVGMTVTAALTIIFNLLSSSGTCSEGL
ncbi:hydrogen gas-evolving membrane-bound hydrogenase subunit E [Solidesulfovibrio sp.]